MIGIALNNWTCVAAGTHIIPVHCLVFSTMYCTIETV